MASAFDVEVSVIGQTTVSIMVTESEEDEGEVVISERDAWPISRSYADRRAARIDADRIIAALLERATGHERMEFFASEAGQAWQLRREKSPD